ncbi:hypothetical protein GCM10023193_42810 [Planotetraspora kaengkrachanensis]
MSSYDRQVGVPVMSTPLLHRVHRRPSRRACPGELRSREADSVGGSTLYKTVAPTALSGQILISVRGITIQTAQAIGKILALIAVEKVPQLAE